MAKVIVVANEKSAVLGFIINLLGLGWFGFDRFYKGDFILGTFKLIMGIFMVFMAIFGFLFLPLIIDSRYVVVGYLVLWILDFILVPLGIIKDNAKKRAKLAMS